MHLRCSGAVALALLCSGIGSSVAHEGRSELPIPTSEARAFRCDAQDCVMPSQGAYPYLVIGRFQATATARQSRQLFSNMRARHLWSALPVNCQEWAKLVLEKARQAYLSDNTKCPGCFNE